MATRYLLDSHVWLWLNGSPSKLSRQAKSILEDRASQLLLSAASIWEIAIKAKSGKLVLPAKPRLYIPERMEANGIEALSIEPRHAMLAADLPDFHRDPFDRMLVAQAITEELVLLTADPQLTSYEAKLLWAGSVAPKISLQP